MVRRQVFYFTLLLSLLFNANGIQTSHRAEMPLEVIDAHTHTNFSGKINSTGILNSAEEYFRQWKQAGIAGAIVMESRQPQETVHLPNKNVFYCAGVDIPVDVARIDAGLRSHQYRCLKIYLGYVKHFASDPGYEPAYGLARKYRVPVVFHTGDTDSPNAKLKYADPLTVDEVAVDHPDLTLVISHCGNPWIESAAEVAYKNKNVYLECSAMLTGDLKKAPPANVEEYMIKPIRWIFGYVDDPKKIMFGTDWPVTDIPSYLDAYKQAIPREHWKAVFHDNAVRVFHIQE